MPISSAPLPGHRPPNSNCSEPRCRDTPSFGLLILAAAGWEAAYPELDLSTFLTPEGVAAAEDVTTARCFFEVVEEFETQDPERFIHTDPGTVEPLASLLEENTPGVRSTDVPIYLYHGERDELVPVVASQLVLDRYCQNGTPASRQVWPGADHSGAFEQALPDIENWIADRLDGVPAPTSC